MPGSPWHQQGSFIDPATPPTDDVDAGTLVQLPCVNKDWVKLICGALDQLRNPTSWGDLSDASMAQVLDRVDKLMLMIGSSVGSPCVNPVVQIALDCTNGLQYKTADGIWHVGTSMADICTCVVGCTVPAVPANPQGSSVAQNACNLSGFLATELIQRMVQAVYAQLSTTNDELDAGLQLMQALGFAFPITNFAVQAFGDAYKYMAAQTLSQVNFVSTDPVFWSEVTCAIYNAIYPDGYVTPANFSAVQANIHAISYTYSWAPNAAGNFIGELGIVNVQQIQNVGALDDVDCSGCGGGPMCFTWDFTASTAGWNLVSGCCGAWQAGLGWYADPPGTHSNWLLQIADSPFCNAALLNEVRITLSCPNVNTLDPVSRHITLYDSGGFDIMDLPISNGVIAAGTVLVYSIPHTLAAVKNIGIYLPQDPWGGATASVSHLLMRGPFKPGCFGANNCPP
jgi:hypothetical protein